MKLHLEQGKGILVLLQHLADLSEVLVVFRLQDAQRVTTATDSCSSSTPVNVSLSVEWTLVVNDVAHERDIKTSGCHVRADKDCTLIWDTRLNVVDSLLEPVETL